jgi:hypothetical protein
LIPQHRSSRSAKVSLVLLMQAHHAVPVLLTSFWKSKLNAPRLKPIHICLFLLLRLIRFPLLHRSHFLRGDTATKEGCNNDNRQFHDDVLSGAARLRPIAGAVNQGGFWNPIRGAKSGTHQPAKPINNHMVGCEYNAFLINALGHPFWGEVGGGVSCINP